MTALTEKGRRRQIGLFIREIFSANIKAQEIKNKNKPHSGYFFVILGSWGFSFLIFYVFGDNS